MGCVMSSCIVMLHHWTSGSGFFLGFSWEDFVGWSFGSLGELTVRAEGAE